MLDECTVSRSLDIGEVRFPLRICRYHFVDISGMAANVCLSLVARNIEKSDR